MKTNNPASRPKWSAAAIAAATALGLRAASFQYTPGDLVLTLRQSGVAADLVVNLGPAPGFSTLTPGATIAIARVDPVLVGAAFPTLNGLSWSVAGANRPPLLDAFPIQTLWVTAPRLDPSEPATPWVRKGQSIQGNAGSQIDAVGKTAAAYSSLAPSGADNTSTAVAIPLTSPFTLGPVLGPSTDYVANFQGSAAQLTPEDFDADPSNVSRADLVELLPGSTAAGTLNKPGRVLGVFEFRPDGTLSFTAATTEVPRPQIAGINRSGDTSSITFPSIAGATYRLRSTDAPGLAAPIAQWSAGASAPGTGSSLTLQDTNASEARLYAIEVLR